MQLFKNRPLFCSCMTFIFSSVVFYFSKTWVKVLAAIICLIAISAVVFLKLYRKKMSQTAFLSWILLFALIICSSVVSFLYFDARYQKYALMPEGEEHSITALVVSQSYYSGGSSAYTVHVKELDGKRVSFDAELECEYLANIQPGNEIKGSVTVSRFEESIGSYKEADMKLSEGIFAKLTSDVAEDIKISKRENNSLRAILAAFNNKLSNKLRHDLGKDEGSICSAIFLGNKEGLPTDIVRDFRRAGASHILAISGLHMSIIFGFIAFIFKKCFMPYKARAITLSFLAVFYLAFTGFSVSATRSVLMLLIVYLSMICNYRSDGLTALSIAGTIILACSPGAILNAGFWMSFVATFGILTYMPLFRSFAFYFFQPHYRKWKLLISPLVTVATAILTSICAIAPLVIVLCVFTKQMSVYSVLSSLMLAIPTELILIMTPLYLALNSVPLIGNILYHLLKLCGSAMINFCSGISHRDNCMISFNYEFTNIAAILLSIVLLVCLARKFKRQWMSAIPFLSALIVFFAAVGITANIEKDIIKVSYVNQQDDRNVIIARDGEQTVVFDMTPGYSTTFMYAFEELSKLNSTEIDAFVLTHYTTAHISCLSNIFESQMVRSLYLPEPVTSDDYFRMMSIMECAEKNNVIVEFYDDGEDIYILDGMTVNIQRDFIKRSTVPTVMLSLKTNNNSLTYLSPSYVESRISQSSFDALAQTDYLIFGSRGPSPKQKYKIQNGDRIKQIVFSSDEIASYYDTDSYVSPNSTLILSPDIHRYEFDAD